MSRQLALGGQPVLVAHWAEALGVVEEHRGVNRLLLVDGLPEAQELPGLVQTAVAHGCALVVCLGRDAEDVQEVVDGACEALGQFVATSWHDSREDPEAALDAFSFSPAGWAAHRGSPSSSRRTRDSTPSSTPHGSSTDGPAQRPS